jgi:hypothetical protein
MLTLLKFERDPSITCFNHIQGMDPILVKHFDEYTFVMLDNCPMISIIYNEYGCRKVITELSAMDLDDYMNPCIVGKSQLRLLEVHDTIHELVGLSPEMLMFLYNDFI